MNKIYRSRTMHRGQHLVSYHDGVQMHKDGSPFFGGAVFGNKRLADAFEKQLRREGYRMENEGLTNVRSGFTNAQYIMGCRLYYSSNKTIKDSFKVRRSFESGMEVGAWVGSKSFGWLYVPRTYVEGTDRRPREERLKTETEDRPHDEVA